MFLLSWTLTPATDVKGYSVLPNSKLKGDIAEMKVPNRFGRVPNLLYMDYVEAIYARFGIGHESSHRKGNGSKEQMTTATKDRSQEDVVPVASFIANVLKRLYLVAPLAVVQIGVYWLLNHFLLRPSRELPLTWIDRATPFMIWTIWAYFALIAMAAVLPLLVRNDSVFRRLLRAYIVAGMVAMRGCFTLFPHALPPPATASG